ncbi:MAG: zinc-ribbon domain-containing transport protein [Chlorobium sp.]|jgi:predicted lipid-binding transport protein (Tim44 family)|nr:MAG: transport protein [Chlorobium sp.]
MRSTHVIKFLFIIALAFLGIPIISEELIARAGGGGGGHGGGSHGGGSGHSSGGFSGWGHSSGGFHGGSGNSHFSPWAAAIILIVLLFLAFRLILFLQKVSSAMSTTLASNENKPFIKIDTLKEFQARNPDFDLSEFLQKIRKAFIEVQTSWSDQNTNRMRRFITDGVYQRFNTQFKMMKLLQQTNPLSNIKIGNIWVDKIEQDGLYDIMQVGIEASMDDKFVCALNHELDEEGLQSFVEFWSFIRKRGVPKKDIYDSDKCPNCSAPLPENIGEVCKCTHCNAMVNSGEFDWILSEITQKDDYCSNDAFSEKLGNLESTIHDMVSVYGDFSVQLVEDKASNAYMQIMTAKAMQDPSVMRRFVSDELFQLLAPKIAMNQEIFNRIFLNKVTLIGAQKKENKNILNFAVICSIQRVLVSNNRLEVVDPDIMTTEEVIVMTRDALAGAGKGSIYQHTCPSCGGPVKDTLDIKCSYCGSLLNSTENDWVVSALMNRSEFSQYYALNK